MRVLKNQIQAKERSLSVGTSFNLSDNHCAGDQSFSEDDYTLSALVNLSHKQSKKQCVFCNLKNLKSYKCLRVTEPVARKEILKQNKNCFTCFDFGHVAKNVNWDYKCKKCNGQRSVSICTFSNNQGDRFNSNDENGENSSTNNLATNWEVFCCKLHMLTFQTSVHKKKLKFVCYSIRKVKGSISVMN